MRNIAFFLLLSCGLSLADPTVKAHGKFSATGNVSIPVSLYTPTATGVYRVTIYAENTTQTSSSWTIDPIVAFTASFGSATADLPFGPISSSWDGSVTLVVHAVAGHLISLTTVMSPSTQDSFTYYWTVEKLLGQSMPRLVIPAKLSTIAQMRFGLAGSVGAVVEPQGEGSLP